MKKQLTPTRALVAVILLSTVVYLAACTKSGASIIGTWAPTSGRTVVKGSNVTMTDTTYAIIPSQTGFSTLTFSSSTQYSQKSYPSNIDSAGTYTYTGGILTFTSGPQIGSPVSASVNGNSLVITLPLDTLSTTPLTTKQDTYTLTKQ